MLRFLILGVCLSLAAPASAQCARLSASGGKQNTNLELKLRGGASLSPVVFFVGSGPGQTNLPLPAPFGNLRIDMNLPFVPVLGGQTDALGSATFLAPIGPTTPVESAYVQAATYGVKIFPPQTGFCTSNVLKVTWGGS